MKGIESMMSLGSIGMLRAYKYSDQSSVQTQISLLQWKEHIVRDHKEDRREQTLT